VLYEDNMSVWACFICTWLCFETCRLYLTNFKQLESVLVETGRMHRSVSLDCIIVRLAASLTTYMMHLKESKHHAFFPEVLVVSYSVFLL
jgi:hypothetical protein